MLSRVLDPGLGKLGGVSGGNPGMAPSTEPVPLLEAGEVEEDNGCCSMADDCPRDFLH